MRIRSLGLLASFALLTAVTTAHAQTTVSLGLRGGLNFATRSGDDPTYKATTSAGTTPTSSSQSYERSGVLAPQFGAVLNVAFGKLAFQPAVLFSQKGASQTFDATSSAPTLQGSFKQKYRTTSRPNYLEIPLNLVYTAGTDHGFQLFAGPYVAFGMGGQATIEEEDNYYSGSAGSYFEFGTLSMYYAETYPGGALSATNPSRPTPFIASGGVYVARRFDAGVNVGVGYRTGPVQMQLGYGLGLLNQQPDKAAAHYTELPAYYHRVVQLNATYFFEFE